MEIESSISNIDQNQANFTKLIVIIMFLIEIILYILPDEIVLNIYDFYALKPTLIISGINWHSIFTYLFLHGNTLHLFSNLFALWTTGNILEKEIGSMKVLVLFFITGATSGLVHTYFYPESTIPLVGASGAIFGIIALLFLYMPFKITFSLILPMPNLLLGFLVIGIELLSVITPSNFGIAHDVHLVGFFTGILIAFFYDTERALKGIIIAGITILVLYFIWIYLNGHILF